VGRLRRLAGSQRNKPPSRHEQLRFEWQVTELERRLLFAADMVTGQFDNDKFLDAARLNNGTLSVSFGSQSGDFGNTVQVPPPENWNPGALVTGDFNGDTRPDLAVTNRSTSTDGVVDKIEVFRGTGDSKAPFVHDPFLSFDVEGGVADLKSLVAGDFNGDGRTDLALLGNDIEESAFPTLEPVEPLGSLIYRGSVHGAIGIDGDEDTYTIDLDKNQTLSLVLTPGENFTPSVRITSALLAESNDKTAGTAGETIQLFQPISVAGRYEITVSSRAEPNETSGTFELELILNSAIEEISGFSSNDTIDMPQNLEDSFFSFDEATRAAVVGTTDGPGRVDDYRFDLAAGDYATLALTALRQGQLQIELMDEQGNQIETGRQGFQNVDRIISGFVARTSGTYRARVSGDAGLSYSLVVTENTDFDIEPNDLPLFAQDLSTTGIAIGSLEAQQTPGPLGSNTEVEPNDDGFVGANADDLPIAQRLAFQSLGNTRFEATVNGTLDSIDDIDLFQFFAAPGDALTVSLIGTTLADPLVRLLDNTGLEIAFDDDGGDGANSLLSFSDFSYSGDYYIAAHRFSGIGTYTLTASATVAALASDYYKLAISAGDALRIETTTPAGPYEFANTLDPTIQLYDPNGLLVLSDDNGAADRRNALAEYTALMSGVYVVQVSATTNSSNGVYTLNVSGHTGSQLIPLTEAEPRGRLIYYAEVDGIVRPAGELPRRTISLEAGQRLTLLVDSDQGLQPTVEVFRRNADGQRVRLGEIDVADMANGRLTLTRVVDESGTYEIEFGGGPLGRSGTYAAQIFVNAIIEEELLVNINSTADTIQSIDDSFVPLHVEGAERAAIVGSLDGQQLVETTLTRFDTFTPGASINFDFSTLAAAAPVGQGRLELRGVVNLVGARVAIIDGLVPISEITVRQSEVLGPDSQEALTWTTVIEPALLKKLLNVTDDVELRITAAETNGDATTGLNGVTVRLSYQSASDVSDVYSFTLSADEAVSLAVRSWENAEMNLWLVDEAGRNVAAGVRENGRQLQIDGFHNPTGLPHRYLAIVAGSNVENYSLVVTRGQNYELEPNDISSAAQPFPASGIITGSLSARDDQQDPLEPGRLFVVDVSASAIIELNPVNGVELNRFPTPEPTLSPRPVGLAYDGASLFFIDGFGSNTLFELDADTGAVINFDRLTQFGFGEINALAFVDGLVAGLDYLSGEVYFGNPDEDTIVRQWSAPPATFLDGMAGATARNSIFISDGQNTVYELDALTGALRHTLSVGGSGIYGLAFVEGLLYVGRSVGSIDVLDPDTGLNIRSLFTTANIYALGGDDLARTLVDRDLFRFDARAGNELTISATTVNGNLDPQVEVFDATGTRVDHTNMPGNELLQFTADLDGQYVVQVTAEGGTSGAYQLSVAGVPFHVTSLTFPNETNNQLIGNVPELVTLQFSDGIDLESLQSRDLLVDEIPASSFWFVDEIPASTFWFVDGRTVTFRLGSTLTEGDHVLTVQGMENLAGEPLEIFSGNFSIDLTAPMVKSIVLPSDIAAGRAGTITITFSELLAESRLTNSDLQLVGERTGPVALGPLTFDSTKLELSIPYSALADDIYTLTLFSGDNQFEDVVGHNLDGNNDGIAGGTFTHQFIADRAEDAEPLEFLPQSPLGSLIYATDASGMQGVIATSTDTDTFVLLLEAGQLAAVVVEPIAAGTLLPALDVISPSEIKLGTAMAAAAGRPLLLQTIPVTEAGEYQLVISGGGATTGSYNIRVFLNAVREEELYGRPVNDDIADAQDLEADPMLAGTGSFVPLVGQAERGAVLGTADASPVGVELYSEHFDDGLGGFVIDNNFGSGNGLWHLTTIGRTADGDPNHSRPGSLYFGQGEGALGGGSYGTATAVGGAVRSPVFTLPAAGPLTLTFRSLIEVEASFERLSVVVMDESGRTTVLPTSSASLPDTTLGAWQTFEIDLTSFAGTDIQLEFTFDTVDSTFNDFEGWYIDDVIVTGTTFDENAPADWYSFTLDDGETASLVATRLGQGDLQLELYDSNGLHLAQASTAADGSQRIANFVNPAAGTATYLARVVGTGEYSLVVMKNADFDTEPNNSLSQAQDISQTLGSNTSVALGFTTAPMGSQSGDRQPVSLPLELFDGNGFLWDINRNGSIEGRDSFGDDPYDGGLVLTSFASSNPTAIEDGRREVVIGPQTISGVDVTRKIYVPDDQGFARFLEVVTNTSSVPINHTLRVTTNLGSDNGTVRVATSSGDQAFTVADNWLVTDDENGFGDVTMLHVIAGAGGQRPSAVANAFETIIFTYNLTLQPGETQIVMHFASQNIDQSSALVKGPQLEDLQLDALVGMSQDELAQVINFQIGDPDFYSVSVTQGDVLTIRISTPHYVPQDSVNALDPTIELYDPNGVPVRQDDNGAPDGRNALGEYTALMTGVYTVRVGAISSAGEYVLEVSGATGEPISATASALPDVGPVDHAAAAAPASRRKSVDVGAIPEEIRPTALIAAALQNENQESAHAAVQGTETARRELLLFLQDASGGFAPTSSIRVIIDPYGESVLLADDFNADWRTDLAIVSVGVDQIDVHTVSVITGFGHDVEIREKQSVISTAPIDRQRVTSGDFNNDGNLDLVIGQMSHDFLKGLGDGSFVMPNPNDVFHFQDSTGQFIIPDVRIFEDPLTNPIVVTIPIPIDVEVIATSDVQSIVSDANIALKQAGSFRTLEMTPETDASGVATITLSTLPRQDVDNSTVILGRFRIIVQARADLPALVTNILEQPAADHVLFGISVTSSDRSEERRVILHDVPFESTVTTVIDNVQHTAQPDANQVVDISDWFRSTNEITVQIVNPPASREFALTVFVTTTESSTAEALSTEATVRFDEMSKAPQLTLGDQPTAVLDLQGFISAGDKDVFRIGGLEPGDFVKISVDQEIATAEEFTPSLRFLDGLVPLHDDASFTGSIAFRLADDGNKDYFLEVDSPNDVLSGGYEIKVERVPLENISGIAIVPVGSSGLPSLPATPQAWYQLKLDQSRVLSFTANSAVFAQPNETLPAFAFATSASPFQAALDMDGTYFVRLVGSGSTISIQPVETVAETAASATYLSIETPVRLDVDSTNGIDWYRVKLEQGSNVSVGLLDSAERPNGLSFFISPSGTAADANRITPTTSGPNFLISGRRDGESHLFIRVDTTAIDDDTTAIDDDKTLVVQRADAFEVGLGPAAAVTADFNQDDVLDVAVANKLSDSVSVLLGVGDGTFSQMTMSPNPTPTLISLRTGLPNHEVVASLEPVSLATGYFNSDPFLDLATANFRSDNVTILLGNGDGTFRLHGMPIPAGDGPVSIQAGDFNRDGDVDLAVANQASNNVTILLGEGTGSFDPADSGPIPVGQNPKALVIDHFNSDGILDFATLNEKSISIRLGLGDGHFPLESPHGIDAPKAIFISDKGADDRNDFIVLTTDAVHWVENRIDHFNGPSPQVLITSPGFKPLALADMDGDGTNDLIMFKPAASGNLLSQLQIMKGNDDGDFVPLGTPSDVRLAESAFASPVVFAKLNTDDTIPDKFGRPTNEPANYLDLIFIDSASDRIRPLTGDGQGGVRTFGTPAESAVPAPATPPPTELDFPELLFVQPSPRPRIDSPPPPLAGAQTISGSGGSTGGTGQIPTEVVELGFEFDEPLPETELESVGTVGVDVLEIDESAFEPPVPPQNVDDLIEPIKLVATETTSKAVPMDEGNAMVVERPEGVPESVPGPDVSVDAAQPAKNNGNNVGWLAGAAAVIVAPLVYWITKVRRARMHKQR
jgi:hypothetical protein